MLTAVAGSRLPISASKARPSIIATLISSANVLVWLCRKVKATVMASPDKNLGILNHTRHRFIQPRKLFYEHLFCLMIERFRAMLMR
jgi:hypothetical protein